jgi:hypothetical protein
VEDDRPAACLGAQQSRGEKIARDLKYRQGLKLPVMAGRQFPTDRTQAECSSEAKIECDLFRRTGVDSLETPANKNADHKARVCHFISGEKA